MPSTNHPEPVTLPAAILVMLGLLLALAHTVSFENDQLPLVLVGVLTGALLLLVTTRTVAFNLNRIWVGWIIVVIGMTVLTFSLSRQGYVSLVAIIWTWIGLVLVFLGQLYGRDSRIERYLTYALIGIQLLAAIYALIIFFPHPFRSTGLLFNANGFGPALLWSVIPTLALSLAGRMRRWIWAVFSILAVTLLLTVSFAAFIALVAPFILLLVWNRRQIRWRRLGIGAGALAAVIVAMFTWHGSVKIPRLITVQEIRFSFFQRLEFNRVALAEAAARPLTGWGLGTYQGVLPRYTHQFDEQPLYAHDTFSQMFSETGLFGGLFFLLFVGLVGWRGWRWVHNANEAQRPFRQGLYCAWIGFSVAAALDFGWFFPAGQIPWMVTSGLFLSAPTFSARPVISSIVRVICALFGIVLITAGAIFGLAALHSFRATLAANHNRTDEAIVEAQQAIVLTHNPQDIIQLVNNLYIRRRPGDLELAESVLRRNLTSNQDNYFLHYWLALILYAEEKKNLALPEFQRALALDHQFHPRFRIGYALALRKANDTPAALRVLDDGLRLYAQPSTNPELKNIHETLLQLRQQIASN